MSSYNLILQDIEKNPLAWLIECQKCGSVVNAKYALALAPILGVTILPHFYCHCKRFQIMHPRPSKLLSSQMIRVVYSFVTTALTSMINYVLKRSRK